MEVRIGCDALEIGLVADIIVIVNICLIQIQILTERIRSET